MNFQIDSVFWMCRRVGENRAETRHVTEFWYASLEREDPVGFLKVYTETAQLQSSMKMGLDQQLQLAAEPVESSIRNYSEMLINYFYLEVLITIGLE